MSEVVTPPSPSPTRRPLSGLRDWFAANAMTVVLAAGFGYYIVHNELNKPTPPQPPIVTTAKAWRDGMGNQLAAGAFRVKNGQITAKDELVSFLGENAKPFTKSLDDAINPNCDPTSGKITNVA